jgi:SAM-dependent methyltransferase
MVGLQQRTRLPELMDDPTLDVRAHGEALCGLARINRVSGSAAAIWRGIRRRLPDAVRVQLLDVACGSADVTLALIHQARRSGVELSVTGCDISPVALEAARDRALQAGLEARFRQVDARAGELPGTFDVVLASLFLHHLSRDESVTLLRGMGAAARLLVVVDDLVRGATGYLMAATAPRLLTRSPVVHVDARLSVRSAFKPAEARALAESAALVDIEVRRHWPARFLLIAKGAA